MCGLPFQYLTPPFTRVLKSAIKPSLINFHPKLC